MRRRKNSEKSTSFTRALVALALGQEQWVERWLREAIACPQGADKSALGGKR